MDEPRSGPRGGTHLLNTDAGMAPGHGRRRVGDPLGDAAVGALVRTSRLATVARISLAIGPATHNEAEYRALIVGLTLARDHGVEHLRAYLDSELVVDQVNGVAAVREARLAELHAVVGALRTRFKSIRFSWVPRVLNAEADRLASDALGVLPAPMDTRPEQPTAGATKKPPGLRALPADQLAARLLERVTIPDRVWTDEPRLLDEKRDAFIRRVLLGES